MADNFISFRRFTALPPNIAEHGATVEELLGQKGKPDPDPVLSPLPARAAAEQQLALRAGGSDHQRLGPPGEPTFNPFEGPKLALVYCREAVSKLEAAVVVALQDHISSGDVDDPRLARMMSDSLRRVTQLKNQLDRNNKLTELIYMRTMAKA